MGRTPTEMVAAILEAGAVAAAGQVVMSLPALEEMCQAAPAETAPVATSLAEPVAARPAQPAETIRAESAETTRAAPAATQLAAPAETQLAAPAETQLGVRLARPAPAARLEPLARAAAAATGDAAS